MPIGKRAIAFGLLAPLAACTTVKPTAVAPPERLLLQQVSPHGAIVKWRGGGATAVCVGREQSDLAQPKRARCVDGIVTEAGHLEARLAGLTPDETYFYSVGGLAGPEQVFRTPPDANRPPRDGNTHIWIIGDSGTRTEEGHEGEAARVLAGFQAYNRAGGAEPVDLFLALGDNAYVAGTDAQWQGAFFDLYPGILKGAFTLPTIGNHEMGYGAVPLCMVHPGPDCQGVSAPFQGVSTSSDPASYNGTGDLRPDGSGLPYLSIFTLPAAGESGGVPSGTEQYYSVDYGNVHLVSLDSQLSARDPAQRAAMKTWLESDLAANERDWTIVIFHHPPYSKGANHDSDTADGRMGIDLPQWDMRNEFTPVFEAHGVDVVYSGHSHSYERSYYLKGLTVTSAQMGPLQDYVELNVAGVPSPGNGDDSYHQLSPTSGNVDDRVVYTVAGSSGKVDDKPSRLDDPAQWLRHPVHLPQPADTLPGGCGDGDCHHGLAVLGSVVIDASAGSLTARFVDEHGGVLDQFTISR